MQTENGFAHFFADVPTRIEEAGSLDVAAKPLQNLATRLTRSDAMKRALSGSWYAHRLHPMLTDVPIGCFTSASIIDFVAWRSGERAARRLVALGLIATVPTIASGLSDWEDAHGGTKRVGVVHAATNSVGALLQFASWRARRKQHHLRGALYGLAGLGAMTAAGYLGGHMVDAERAGVDHEVPLVDDHSWHPVCRQEEPGGRRRCRRNDRRCPDCRRALAQRGVRVRGGVFTRRWAARRG
jgi:uncharacterized membrane protein